jgi:hypothetical protein
MIETLGDAPRVGRRPPGCQRLVQSVDDGARVTLGRVERVLERDDVGGPGGHWIW